MRNGRRTARLSLVERLEVIPDLGVVVAWDLLPRNRVLHRLPILSDDAHVRESRRHLAGATRHVRVVAVLLALARFSFDADVVGAGAQPLRRLALRRRALSPAGEQPFALSEVLVFRTALAASAVATA